MPGSLPLQSQKEMYSSQPELSKNWPKYYTKEADQHKMKLKEKDKEHRLNQISTSNCYTAVLEEGSQDQQQKAGPENIPNPPPIYITDIKNISPLVQLLEQIAKQQYEIKALADNQVKVQPKTYESYRTVIKALAKKHTEFHTYKLKEERTYRAVLKNMHYSINPQEIKTEIEKLGHMVTNIWNVKRYRTKLPLSMFFFFFLSN
jgi:hypothetical protein